MILYVKMPQLILLCSLILPVILFLHAEERRTGFWWRGMGTLVLGVLGLWLYNSLPGEPYPIAKQILGYFLVYFLTVLFAWFMYRITPVGAVFISSCSYVLQHIAFCLQKMMLENRPIWPWSLYMDLFLPLLMSLLFYALFYRKYRFAHRNADYHQVILSMVILFICIALNSLRSRDRQVNFYMDLYDILLCISCLVLQLSISQAARIQTENRTLELLIQQQHEQHQLSSQAVDMLNMKIHDMRHRIADIQQAMNKAEGEKLKPFLRTLQIYDTMAKTGSPVLDTVLTEKGLMCEINRIRFSFIVDGKELDFMEAADLYTLVSNILDNAIESECKEEETERRMIVLRVMRKGEMVLVDAENTCRYPVDVRDNTVRTTKSDQENHGIGMKGIEYVVKKYEGTMTLSQEDEMFRVSVVFPVPKERTA